MDEAQATKAFENKACEAACYVENCFDFASFAGGDGLTFFSGDHSEEALAEFAVEDENVEDGVQVAGENEGGECRKVEENVGEGVEHFSEIADFVIFAGIVAV